MDTSKLAVLALTVATVAACATAPATNPALTQARQAYQSAATDTTVTRTAALELRKAEEALRRAEAAQAQGATTDEVVHQAYLAQRRVDIARTTAELRQAREVVASAGEMRAEALLEGRTQELQQVRGRNAELESELQAERTERGLVLTLGDVLFAVGEAGLTPGARGRLDLLAEYLRDNPDRRVVVEGYTDSTGSSDLNLRLSEARANAVREALTARGLSPDRVIAQGYGAARPVASNATEAGRQANRRVEVVIQGAPPGEATGAS